MQFRLLFLCKGTSSKLSVQLDAGRGRGAGEELSPSVSSASRSVVSLKESLESLDHSTSRLCLAQIKAFFCLLRRPVFSLFLSVVQS